MGPWDGVRGGSRSAEEPGRAEGARAASLDSTRQSEKAKVSEEALLTRGSKAKKPMNACVHTYTKSQHQAHGDAAPAGEYMEV